MKTLHIMSSFIEQEINFLYKLADKSDIKIPGKDKILPRVDIIPSYYQQYPKSIK